jgi:hypothetical protein
MTLLCITIQSTKKVQSCVGALRREAVAALKSGLESQPNVFRKQSSDSSSALGASYSVAHLLAKESRLFYSKESVHKNATYSARQTIFNIVSLSHPK